MSDIAAFLDREAVAADLPVPTKRALFPHLGQAAARLTGLDAQAIAAGLAERERLGTTGFGGGVAIPHGRVAGLSGMFGYFARLAQPIDYRALDSLPVDLVFMLLSPPEAGADHLKALAAVSRRLRDPAFLAKLRGARSTDALYALLAGAETRDAA